MLGDRISSALESVGVTQERVSRWLGRPCSCPERVERLNQLERWARRVMRGSLEMAADYLDRIMGDG